MPCGCPFDVQRAVTIHESRSDVAVTSTVSRRTDMDVESTFSTIFRRPQKPSRPRSTQGPARIRPNAFSPGRGCHGRGYRSAYFRRQANPAASITHASHPMFLKDFECMLAKARLKRGQASWKCMIHAELEHAISISPDGFNTRPPIHQQRARRKRKRDGGAEPEGADGHGAMISLYWNQVRLPGSQL